MAFIDKMKERYSTKLYNPDVRLEPEIIEDLKEVLRLSPSSINSQPWQFVFVGDQDLKSDLAEASYGNKNRVEDCSHLVVFNVFTDIEKFRNHLEQNIPARTVEYFTNSVMTKGKYEIINWLSKQVYLSLGIFLAACAEMGVDATPMEGINVAQYNEILNQEGYTALVAVAIGKRHVEDFNQPHKVPKSRAHINDVIVEI